MKPAELVAYITSVVLLMLGFIIWLFFGDWRYAVLGVILFLGIIIIIAAIFPTKKKEDKNEHE